MPTPLTLAHVHRRARLPRALPSRLPCSISCAACGGSSDHTGPAATGSLAVTIAAPAGVSTPVSVEWPGGRIRRRFRRRRRSRRSAPGSYSISANPRSEQRSDRRRSVRRDGDRQPRYGHRGATATATASPMRRRARPDTCGSRIPAGNAVGGYSTSQLAATGSPAPAITVGASHHAGRERAEHRGGWQRRNVDLRQLRFTRLFHRCADRVEHHGQPRRACSSTRAATSASITGIALDGQGNLWLAIAERSRVRIFGRAGCGRRHRHAERHADLGLRIDQTSVGTRLRCARQPVGLQLRQQLGRVVHAGADRGEWLTAAERRRHRYEGPHGTTRHRVRQERESVGELDHRFARRSFPPAVSRAVGSPAPTVVISGHPAEHADRIGIRRERRAMGRELSGEPGAALSLEPAAVDRIADAERDDHGHDGEAAQRHCLRSARAAHCRCTRRRAAPRLVRHVLGRRGQIHQHRRHDEHDRGDRDLPGGRAVRCGDCPSSVPSVGFTRMLL